MIVECFVEIAEMSGLDVRMIIQGLARMQDDIFAMAKDENRPQKERNDLIKDFDKFLANLVELTSPLTIEKEVAKVGARRKQLKEKLQ
jgi:hypothetical protein